MIKYLFALTFIFSVYNAKSNCQIYKNIPNPTVGEDVTFSLIECEPNCYYSCLISHATWTIFCTGTFTINGVTYTNNAIIPGTSFTATFHNNTNVNVIFGTGSFCSEICSSVAPVNITIGPDIPVTLTNPSTNLVPDSLINAWKTAGVNWDEVPTDSVCFNIHLQDNIVVPFEDGFKVNIDSLNQLINSTDNVDILKIIYFQEAKYYFDKSDQIIISKNNVVLSGEGANKTKFIIDDIDTEYWIPSKTFITINGRNNIGIKCLRINTINAFAKRYLHNKEFNSYFKNRSVISISTSNNIWIHGVRVERGYGSTVFFNKSDYNEVKNCFFYDHWTVGGTHSAIDLTNAGGTQGYSVLVHASDFNLIENNKLGLARHNVVIQGDSNTLTVDNRKSDYNVVAYNYCYEGKAKNFGYLQNHPWNITLHGKGENSKNLIEGNLLEDKIGIDKVHGSNGTGNTLYRNVIQTQIDIEDDGDDCYNQNQRFILNKVNKRTTYSRFKIRSNNHFVINGNEKCNSSGSTTNNGTFNVGNKCTSGKNKNHALNSSHTAGQSCYLDTMPNFASNLPINIYLYLPAKTNPTNSYSNCELCENIVLPETNADEENETSAAFSIQQTTSIENKEKEGIKFRAYPNPFKNFVTISIDNYNQKSVSYRLLNVSGKLVETKNIKLNGNNSFELTTTNLKAGIYFIVFRNNNVNHHLILIKN